jgi:uncharacterized protein DUF6328
MIPPQATTAGRHRRPGEQGGGHVSSAEPSESGPAPAPDPRDETEAERDDRNLIELLQELRVLGLGIQVLFGFLLSLPFTNRFSKLGHGERGLYIASLILSAVSTALLLGPVAYHRLVFRQRLKESLVRTANVMAIGGLVTVSLSITTAVLLVTGYVEPGWPSALITALVALLFAALWFALPLSRRDRAQERAKP